MNSITKYKPWKGLSLIGLSILFDVIFGKTGLIFIIIFFAVVIWATHDEEPEC